MKRSEKMLIGGGMILVGLGILGMFGSEQWNNFSNNTIQADTLNKEIQSMTQQQEGLQRSIENLKKGVDLPQNITIREYTPETRDAIIKAVVDQVVGKATASGNTLISLTPVTVDPFIPADVPETPDPNAPADPNAAPADGSTPPAEGGEAAAPNPDAVDPASTGAPVIAIGEQAPAGPPKPALETFGYELAIRGTYDSLQSFLRSLASNKELMEVLNIRIENETGVSRVMPDKSTGTGDVALDPSRPIKLTATIRLVMQSASSKTIGKP